MVVEEGPEPGQVSVADQRPPPETHTSFGCLAAAALRQVAALTFFHPDFTVGPGISPGRGTSRTVASCQWQVAGLLPTFFLLTRHSSLVTAFQSLAGFTADRELGSELPSPCPEGLFPNSIIVALCFPFTQAGRRRRVLPLGNLLPLLLAPNCLRIS
jgi:hypothetical protein